jgi:hypothetical protein
MFVKSATFEFNLRRNINLCKLDAFIVWLSYFEGENGRGQQAILGEIVEPDLLIYPK